MNSKDLDENPQDLDCVLELRIQGDYCRSLVRVKEDGEDDLFSRDVSLKKKWEKHTP